MFDNERGKGEVMNNEKLNEMAEEYVEHCISNGHSVNGISAAYCKADFKAGFQAALSLPEVKAMKEALEKIAKIKYGRQGYIEEEDIEGELSYLSGLVSSYENLARKALADMGEVMK